MATALDDWRVLEATNQTIFREMNEWTEDDHDARQGSDRAGFDAYLCECGDGSCSDPILLTRTEYEAVRSIPIRFAIAMDHENPEIDLLVAEHGRYAVVDKVYRETAWIALGSDPRR